MDPNLDPTATQKAWYYIDSWQWVSSTWGGGGGGAWQQASAKGPFYDTAWTAGFESQWAANDLKLKGAKFLVRRFRWTGVQWVREA